MRLFIAIPIPTNIQDYLLDLQKLFKPHGTYTFTKETHLTLKFLGDIRPAQLETLIPKLQHITFTPFTISLDTLEVFPNITTPHVLWASITPTASIINLHQQIDKTLQPDFPPDTHFNPHLTIARIKNIINKSAFTKLLITPLEHHTFTINNFSLIESTLHQKGPMYTIKATFGK